MEGEEGKEIEDNEKRIQCAKYRYLLLINVHWPKSWNKKLTLPNPLWFQDTSIFLQMIQEVKP